MTHRRRLHQNIYVTTKTSQVVVSITNSPGKSQIKPYFGGRRIEDGGGPGDGDGNDGDNDVNADDDDHDDEST